MMRSRSLAFGTIVRAIGKEARSMGLVVPIYRSPPGLPATDRTICRRHGDLVVSVRSRGRPFADVTADVVAGILLVNGVGAADEMRVRRRLLKAVEAELREAA
jgi:hypothetical protein